MTEARFGKFQLQKLLARGGMAEIHLAIERTLHAGDRLVVLKRILPAHASDPDYVEFFVHEARVALQLMHPNIVQAYEFGLEGDVHFLSMEYVRGYSALEMIRRAALAGRGLAIDAVVKIAADVAAGLDYVHQARDAQGKPLNIVHRDVSPHNIVIAREGLAKLVDFGIARASCQEFRTRTGVIKGKFAYLAPEQLRRGARFDHRADLFALGVVMYELITRRPLFRGSNDADTVKRILSGRIPPLRDLRPDCPAALAAVVHKALERDPDARYATGGAMLADLEEAARSSGIFPTMTRLRTELDNLFDDGQATSVWDGPPAPRAPSPRAPSPAPASISSPPKSQVQVPAAAKRPTSPPRPATVPANAAAAAPMLTGGVPVLEPSSEPVLMPLMVVAADMPSPLPANARLASPRFDELLTTDEPIPDKQLEYFLHLASARRSRADTVNVAALNPEDRDPVIEPDSQVHQAADPELLRLLGEHVDSDPDGRATGPRPMMSMPLPAPPHQTPPPERFPRASEAPPLMDVEPLEPVYDPMDSSLDPPLDTPVPQGRAISSSDMPAAFPSLQTRQRRERLITFGLAAAFIACCAALYFLVA